MLLLLPAGRRAGVQAQPAGLTHAIRPHVPGRRQRQRMPQSRLVPRPRHGMARGMHRHHDLFNAVRTTRTCGRMGMPRTRHGMGGGGVAGSRPGAFRPAGQERKEPAGRQAGRPGAFRPAGQERKEPAGRQAGRQARCRVRHERPCPNRVLSDQRASGRLPIP